MKEISKVPLKEVNLWSTRVHKGVCACVRVSVVAVFIEKRWCNDSCLKGIMSSNGLHLQIHNVLVLDRLMNKNLSLKLEIDSICPFKSLVARATFKSFILPLGNKLHRNGILDSPLSFYQSLLYLCLVYDLLSTLWIKSFNFFSGNLMFLCCHCLTHLSYVLLTHCRADSCRIWLSYFVFVH